MEHSRRSLFHWQEYILGFKYIIPSQLGLLPRQCDPRRLRGQKSSPTNSPEPVH